jgi:hypothetical protein
MLDAARSAMNLERLADRLAAEGPVPVRATVLRHGGQRVDLHLDEHTSLELRLFRARSDAVIQLDSIRWDDGIGWVLVVWTAQGERRIDDAWLATIRTTTSTTGRQRPASRSGHPLESGGDT